MVFGNLRIAELAPAPCAAQVQSVEMRDLSVAAVADDSRRKQCFRLAIGNARQELLEPRREQRRMSARDAQSLDQRWRQEFVSPGLPRLAIAIGPEPLAREVADEGRERRIERLRPFERQDQRERGVEMRA